MQFVRPLLLCGIPILSLGFSNFIFSIALHCSNQRHRLYLLPFFVALSVFTFTSAKYFWFIPSVLSLWSVASATYILHITSLLYIEKWPVPHSAALAATQQHKTSKIQWCLDFRATYKLWANPQLLGTVVAPTHPRTKTQPRYVFLLRRLIKLPIYYFLHSYAIPWFFSQTIVEFLPEDVSPIQETMLRRLQHVTAREIVIRGYTAIVWILESVIFLDSAHIVSACCFVLVGLDSPSDWPVLFGSPRSATSLRKFWSKFWHRLPVRPYTNYGKLVARGLGLQHGTFASKAIIAFVIFGLSGATHSAASWRMGQHDWHLDIWWFFLNFLGCLAETIWVSAIRSFAKSIKRSRELKLIEGTWVAKFLGFAWVFGFLFWSTPKWKYPGLYREAVEMEMWNSFISSMSIVPN